MQGDLNILGPVALKAIDICDDYDQGDTQTSVPLAALLSGFSSIFHIFPQQAVVPASICAQLSPVTVPFADRKSTRLNSSHS
jgi:hypothetical protein